AATPSYAQVKDSDLSLSDITTNNASTSNHGFLKKLSNNATEYMDGTGNWSTPSVGAGRLIDVQAFTASGPWPKPGKSTADEGWVVGGGGGGGGADGSGTNRGAGGGGGGGGCAYKFITTSLGATETVTVGAAGSAGSTTGGNGGSGGTSSFGSHCSA